MSNRRVTADNLILPYSVGLLIGSVFTGATCLALGMGKSLVGMGELEGRVPILFGSWMVNVAVSIFTGSLLAAVILKLLSFSLRFPLSVRLSFANVVILGTVCGSALTILSCLTIDLGPHPELHFYKGPDPPFWKYAMLVYALAPFLLIRRDESSIPSLGPNTGQPQSPPAADQPSG